MYESISSKKMMLMVLIMGLFSMPVGSLATNVTISPTDDTYVDAFNPSSNFGTLIELNCGFQTVASDSTRCRTFLKFDLSSIPANSVINSAELELEAISYNSTLSPTKVAVHNVYPLPWSETNLTWNSSPNSSAGFAGAPTYTVLIPGTGTYTWIVTPDVITAHAGVGTYSALLKVVEDEFDSSANDFVQFRDDYTAKLIIYYSSPNLEPTDPPPLTGNVKVIIITEKLEPYKDTTDLIYWEDDDYNGNPDEHRHYQGEDPTNISLTEKFEITYTGFLEGGSKPTFVDSEPNLIKIKVVELNYDSLGRFEGGSSDIENEGDPMAIPDIELGYNTTGNVISTKVNFDDESSTSWTLGYDPNDNIFKRVYEQKDNSSGAPVYRGMVDYFLSNVSEQQLLYKTFKGASGETMNYVYDADGRLTNITQNIDTPLREYTYDEGRLTEFTNHENASYDSAISYTIDRISGLLTDIESQTNSSDPNHIFFGYMTLDYYDNGTIHKVNFSSDEVPPDPVTPVYSVNYAYNNQDRLFKMEIISHDENVPDLTIIMDPNSAEGDYMGTQYIYDNFGRLAWTVDTCGNVNRIFYNEPDLKEKEMAQIHMEGPGELYITSFEHTAASDIIRSTDLAGHFTQYEYDSNGKLFNSYVLGTQGGAAEGALGQVFQMFAYDHLNNSPDESVLRFEWDQYGDFGVIIEEGEVGMNGGVAGIDAAKKKAKIKLSRSKRAIKHKPAEFKKVGCLELVVGDHNGDCVVNFIDWAIFSHNWLLDKRN